LEKCYAFELVGNEFIKPTQTILLKMRKVLLLIMALGVIVGAQAQNKSAYKKLSDQTALSLQSKIDANVSFNVPIKPRMLSNSNKAMSSVAIGTSGNIFTIIAEGPHWLDACPETNSILFVHRQGGAWGGNGGYLYSKVTSNWGATWDSLSFQPATAGRYPNGRIHNPSGNTNPDEQYYVLSGPQTNGSGWVSNYYTSNKKGGTPNMLEIANPNDSTVFMSCMDGANGYYNAVSTVSMESGVPLGTKYYKIMNGVFNTNQVNWAPSYIHNLWKVRALSNGNYPWTFNDGIAMNNNGLHGYFYCVGNDSASSPYNTGLPVLWETNDGGATWVKEPVFHDWHLIPAIKDQIWPTRASLDLPSDQWVYRPNFPAGSSFDPSSYPAVVDAYGNLHIACVIEGMYSNHPDSLDYTYATHPQLLFDVFQQGSGWNAIFIDTLRANMVAADASPFTGVSGGAGWGHWINISKSPDGKKVFVSWTDTDTLLYGISDNLMPEPKSWGFNIENYTYTDVTSFETGNANIYYLKTSSKTLFDGTKYQIPATFIDIYQSNLNTDGPQKHYLLKGIEFNDADFYNTFVITPIQYSIQVSPSANICSGQTATLTAPAGVSYLWNTNENTPTIAVSASGTYSVIVYDGVGGQIISNPVYVTVSPNPIANAGNDATICQGLSTTLTATGGTNYSWSNSVGNTASVTVSPAITTTYTVTVTNTANCSATDQVLVTVNPAPSANAGTDQTVCQGQSATLTATGGANYSWSNGSTGSTIAVTPLITSTYNVTVYGSNGCSTTDNVMITVNPLPTANAGNDQSICQGQTATLSATGGLNYSWNNGDSESTITVTPASTTTYFVTVYDSNGCSATDNIAITVNNNPEVSVGIDTSICLGGTAFLNATGGTLYAWSNGPNTSANIVSPSSTTTYTVTVTEDNCSASSQVIVTVYPVPVADAGTNQNICEGDAVTLSASGGVTFLWSNGVINDIPFIPTATTTYSVTVTDSNGCTATDNVSILVNANPLIPSIVQNGNILLTSTATTYQWYLNTATIPGATSQIYTPQSNGLFQVEVFNAAGCSSISSFFNYNSSIFKNVEWNTEIIIYPNPAHNEISVVSNLKGLMYEMNDIAGHCVAKNYIEHKNSTIELNSISKGIYIVKFYWNNDLVKIEKIVVL